MGATGGNRVSRVFWKAQTPQDVLGFGLALAARQFTTKYHPELGFGIMPQKNFPTSPYKVCIIAIRGLVPWCSQQASLGMSTGPRDSEGTCSHRRTWTTLDDRNLGAQIALGFIALAGFLASHVFSTINAQISEHELRLRAIEVAVASIHKPSEAR